MRRKKTKSSLTSSVTRPSTVLRRQRPHHSKPPPNTFSQGSTSSRHVNTNRKWIDELKKDKTIFRPDGRIVFPRSDGQTINRLQYTNTATPGPNDVCHDYYVSCAPSDSELVDFREKCGKKIAEMLDLDPKINWRLHSLPERYQYVIQHIKMPSKRARVWFYLLGSKQTWTGFRSANEFAPHALWLLRDATLERTNCTCPYCLPTRDQWQQETARLVGKTLVPLAKGRQPFKFEAQAEAGPLVSGRVDAARAAAASQGGIQSSGLGTRASPIGLDDDSSDEDDEPDEVDRQDDRNDVQSLLSLQSRPIEWKKAPNFGLLPGVAPSSAADRANEFDELNHSNPGDSGGFRRGEYVYCSLRIPITNTQFGEQARINEWPAVVEEVEIKKVPCQSVESGKEGNVTTTIRQVKYTVRFLGTSETLEVSTKRLQPGLASMRPDQRLFDLIVGSGTLPSLDEIGPIHLKNELQRPTWHRMVLMYLLQSYTCRVLCSTHVLTDTFRHSRRLVRPPTISKATASTNEKDSARPPICPHTNYLEFERENDGDQTRRTLPAHEASASLEGDTNTYWQGLYLGLERIWVGDVVRLRLTRADVEMMLAALRERTHLFNPDDSTEPDLASAFVVRIKAIYRGQDEAQVRVAGDVFRIVDKAKAERRNDERKQMSSGGRYLTVSARPCIPSSDDGKLPATPHLCHTFAYQRVSQGNAEVVFTVEHLAGRLYPHLWVSDPERRSRSRRAMLVEQRKRDFLRNTAVAPSETAQDHLCMAGVLPGLFKAMEVDGTNCASPSSEAAYRASFDVAVAKMKELLHRYSDRAVHTHTTQASRWQWHNTRMDVDQDFDDSRASADTTSSNETSSTMPSSDGGQDAELEQVQSTLPPGWIVARSTSLGKLYYHNTHDGSTQWRYPP